MFEGSIKRPYKAVNTFSRRPCLNQILSYLLLALDNFSFWLTVQNHYASETARYAIIALFLLSLLALLVLGGLTSSSDPADPIMAHHRNGLTYEYSLYEIVPGTISSASTANTAKATSS